MALFQCPAGVGIRSNFELRRLRTSDTLDIMIDWTGVIHKGFTGIRRDKVEGTMQERDGEARYFVGIAGQSVMMLICAYVTFKVNPWLGAACFAVAARRWPEVLHRDSQVITPPSKLDDFSLYLETIKILGKDELGLKIQDTFGTMRGHGKDEQLAAKIALQHYADDIREAGLNLPERF